jgi:hypothetical protein
MKSDVELRLALADLSKKPLSGLTYRVVGIKYVDDPLNAIGSTSLNRESETQRLGRIVQELGQLDALIAPSAKHSGHANLAVFISALTKTGGSVLVEDPDSLVKIKQLP